MADFAPSWLKVPSSLSSQQKPQSTNNGSSSQQKQEASLSLRPHYLKSNGENGAKGAGGSMASSKEPPPKKELSSLELAFRESLDFAHHVPTKSSSQSAHTQSSANTRTHSLEESNGGDGVGTNGSHLSNRRSYQRPRLDEKQHQARPHSRHDFRELAAFQTHSKPDAKKNLDAKSNPNEDKQAHKANGKKDLFQEEFPSLAPETPIQESKTVWDSAQAKAKVLNGRTSGSMLTTLSLSSKLAAPKTSTLAADPTQAKKKSTTVSKISKEIPMPLSITSGAAKKLPVTNIFKKWTPSSPTLANGPGSPSMEVLVKNTIKTRINQKAPDSSDVPQQQSSPSRTSSVSSSQSEKSEIQKQNVDSHEQQQQQQAENGIQIAKVNGHNGYGYDRSAPFDSNGYATFGNRRDNGGRDEPDSIASNNSSRDGDFSDHQDQPKYSASLEAEIRLLREMGWEGNDDTEGEGLTEDEVREFQNWVNKRGPIRRPKFELQLNNARNNKLQSGLFSPAHLRPTAPNKQNEDSDDSTSSSDDSSDDEVDNGLLL